jgi:hypothetical protein
MYRYNGLEQLDSVSHIIRFQYLKEHRNSVRIDDEDAHSSPSTEDLSIIATLMCECMVAASQFVQFGYDYYKYVCGTDEKSSSAEEKSCLIPVCSFQPNNPIQSGKKRVNNKNQEDRNTLNFSDDSHMMRADKRPRLNSSSNSSIQEEEEDEYGRGRGLDSYCVTGVDDALQILSKAADCLRHIVELWQWASGKLSQKKLMDNLGGWEQGILPKEMYIE